MRKLTINRNEWLRGGRKQSYLWSSCLNGGCCLGHACIQLEKIPKDQIDGLSYPYQILRGETKFTRDVGGYSTNNNAFSRQAIYLNDTATINSEAERERRLIELFSQHGIELSFYTPEP